MGCTRRVWRAWGALELAAADSVPDLDQWHDRFGQHVFGPIRDRFDRKLQHLIVADGCWEEGNPCGAEGSESRRVGTQLQRRDRANRRGERHRLKLRMTGAWVSYDPSDFFFPNPDPYFVLYLDGEVILASGVQAQTPRRRHVLLRERPTVVFDYLLGQHLVLELRDMDATGTEVVDRHYLDIPPKVYGDRSWSSESFHAIFGGVAELDLVVEPTTARPFSSQLDPPNPPLDPEIVGKAAVVVAATWAGFEALVRDDAGARACLEGWLAEKAVGATVRVALDGHHEIVQIATEKAVLAARDEVRVGQFDAGSIAVDTFTGTFAHAALAEAGRIQPGILDLAEATSLAHCMYVRRR